MRTSSKRQIETTLRDAGIHYGMWTRSAQLQERSGANDDGGLEWVLTTELPTTVFDWERWEFVQEVLVADGMMVPAVGRVPLLDSHNRFSSRDVLGHVRDFAEAAAGGHAGRSGMVYFADDEDSQVIKQKVLGRHITDGSVGYHVHKSVWVPEDMEASVLGKTYRGPVKVSYGWTLKEFSVTPIGADVLAKVRLLCGNGPR